MRASEEARFIKEVWGDTPGFQAAFPVYQAAVAHLRGMNSVNPAEASSLFADIDKALADGVDSGYLLSLLTLTDKWNDMCLMAEVAPTAYENGMAREYVAAVYLLDYAFDDWKTLSERLAELHNGDVPAEYAAQVASQFTYVSDIVAAWKAGIAPEYVSTMR